MSFRSLVLYGVLMGVLKILPAQDVPGYQGKKMSIGYASSVSLAAYQLNSSLRYTKMVSALTGIIYADEQFASTVAFNLTHSVNFNYVYSRYRSLFASASFMRTGCYYDTYYSSSFNTSAAVGKMTGFGFEFGQKKYSYDLAPLGFYFAKKFGANIYFADVPTGTTTMFLPDSFRLNFKKRILFNPRFVYSFGKQNILGDKILYDYSVDFDCVAPLRYFLYSIQEESQNGPNNTDIAAIRTVLRDVFYLRFGFSYLF